MKFKLFFLALFAGALTIASCGDDDPVGGDDDGTVITDDGPTYTDASQVAQALGGDGKDSLVWLGQHFYRSTWDPLTQDFSTEEKEVTEDPNILFTQHSMWIKYNDYQSGRLEYPVGKLQWIDAFGKSGMNWEFNTEELDVMYMNNTEQAPSKHQWTDILVSDTKFEFQREWRSGGTLYKERYVWVKKS